MDTKKLFAIDLGASGGKCFVGTVSGDKFRMDEVHRFAYEGVDFFLPDRSGNVVRRTYWNDTLIYENILQGLRKARRASGGSMDSIGVDTWGADGMMISEDGEALGKIYCYRDHRLDTMIEEVKERIDPAWLYSVTGVHFQPFNMSNQLLWFVTRRKDLLRPHSRLLPIPTVFNYYLGGAMQVDSTWASVTQLMDARTRKWDPDVLDALGIPARILPDIVEPGTVLGRMHPELSASLDMTPPQLIAVASHDTASAFAAAPVRDRETSLIISSGTWSLVGKLIDRPLTSLEAMKANISNEGGIGNTRFLKNCMGSWIAQELLRGWEAADGRAMDWREADERTLAAKPFRGMIDPDDRGFYNPPDMEKAVRDFLARTGQPDVEDRGALLRVVYESLALKYRRVDETLNAVIGAPPTKSVHIVGGGAKNVLLNQFAADAMGVEVLAGPVEATAAGNLMAQAMALGLIEDVRDAQPWIRSAFEIKTFRPGDRAAWEKAYPRFCELCARG